MTKAKPATTKAAEKKPEPKAATAVAVREEPLPPAPALPPELQGSWGTEGVHHEDVKVPKLLLMQGQSKLVTDMKANVGDIVRSTTGEVVIPRGQSARFIPLMTQKGWRIMEEEDGVFNWRRNEPLTDANKNRELEWEENGTRWRADRTLDFYVLLLEDIEKEAEAMKAVERGETPEATPAFPCLLQFTRTSYSAGRDLITHFATAAKFRKPPAAWHLQLKTESQENDKGKFIVLKVGIPVPSTIAQLTLAKEWYDVIKKGAVKVHEPVDEETPAAPGAEPVADDMQGMF